MSETLPCEVVAIGDAADFLIGVRQRRDYYVMMLVTDLNYMVEKAEAIASWAVTSKVSGFIWISPGRQMCFIRVDKPRQAAWSHKFLRLIGGGYVERCQVLLKVNGKVSRKTMLVDEEGLIKQLPFNPVATELYREAGGSMIAGEALVSIGSTGWNM